MVKKTVVIYEDNKSLRHSLKLLIEDEPKFLVLADFANCLQVLENMQTFAPDLVIMDIDMPGMNGIEAVKIIKQNFPNVQVLMYTVFDDDNRIYECIRAGADGYILKNTSPENFIIYLNDLINGGAAMSPFVGKKVFEFFRNQNKLTETNLTTREKDILQFLVKGNSYKMIADKAGISVDTVKKHLQNIYHKLHVSCGTEAVAKAIRHKIVLID